jgi:hypothetical protein
MIAALSPTRTPPLTLKIQPAEFEEEMRGDAIEAIATDARSPSEKAPFTMIPSSRN